MAEIFDLLCDSPSKKVVVQDKEFFVKVLSALERDTFETQWLSFKNDENVIGIRAFMTAFCLCDEAGSRTFDSGNKSKANQDFVDAVVRIGDLPAGKVQPIFSVAMAINGFSDEEVGELEKK